MAKLNPTRFQAKNGKQILLRSPEVGEGAQLLKTVVRIMQTSEHLLTQPDEFHFTPEQEDGMIKSYHEHPDKIIIVPECDGQIVGMLSFFANEKRRHSHVGNLSMSLLPEFRGVGVGGRMLQALLSWARANPRLEKVNLEVHSTNLEAVKLYEKSGFRLEGAEVKGAKLAEGVYDDVLHMACFVK